MKFVSSMIVPVLFSLLFFASASFIQAQESLNPNSMKQSEKNSFYEYSAISIDGEEIGMDTYKGKVVLVVNTASKCGFTPQYEGLEKLHREYGDKGLVVLGFPCNQFGNQEPGSEGDIASFCQLNYGVSFQMFSKIDVNGDNTHPIYRYLKSQKGGGLFGDNIKWNFTKFLIDKDGKVVDRFASTTKPESLVKDIEKLLY